MECSRPVLLKRQWTYQSLGSETVGRGRTSECIPDILSDMPELLSRVHTSVCTVGT